MTLNNTVIVLDNANYNANYAEQVPFKAEVFHQTENEIWVRSLATGKEYELYPTQILECFAISEIKKLIDLNNYGK